MEGASPFEKYMRTDFSSSEMSNLVGLIQGSSTVWEEWVWGENLPMAPVGGKEGGDCETRHQLRYCVSQDYAEHIGKCH